MARVLAKNILIEYLNAFTELTLPEAEKLAAAAWG
jgi:hypothetical protein